MSDLTKDKEPIKISTIFSNEDAGRKFQVEMSEYQLTNLLWALKHIYYGTDGGMYELDTGDWVGELPNKIESELGDKQIELFEPNGNRDIDG